MIIRRAECRDAWALARVRITSWQVGYRGLLPQAYLDGLSIAHDAERWGERLANPDLKVLVAEVDGQVEGFLTYAPCRDEGREGTGAEIVALYVHPQHWRQGLGRALVNAALAEMRGLGYGSVALWVLRDNDRAQRFYKALGLVADGAARTEISRDGVVLPEVRYCRALSGPACPG